MNMRCPDCMCPMMPRPYETDRDASEKHGVNLMRYNWRCPNCDHIEPAFGVISQEIITSLVSSALRIIHGE